jgi:hypothetical protein
MTAIGFKMGGDVNMTSLQGYIQTSYADLVGCFGEPTCDGDGYKVDAEWIVTFADGVVATIYNYKTGRNYCGEEGQDVEDITQWHIGGHPGTDAEGRVEEVMSAYLDCVCTAVKQPSGTTDPDRAEMIRRALKY